MALLCFLGACGKQTLEGGSLGRGDAQADGPLTVSDAQADGPVSERDAQGDGSASLTCTYNGVVYANGATMPGWPGCYDCQCLNGSRTCPLLLCLAPSIPTLCAITANLKDANPGVGYRSPDVPLPTTHQFSLLIDWQGKTAMTGANGTAAKVTISMDDSNGEWSTQGDLELDPVLYPTQEINDHRPTLRYRQISIRPTIDGCAGRATGTFTAITGGDVIFEIPFEAELAGATDHMGPSLAFSPEGSTELHPLDVQGVRASELLPVGTSARLLADDGTVVPLTSLPVASPVGVSGFLVNKSALDFATTYRLQVLPSVVDLAGNSTTVLPTVTTRQGPGLFAQDGFEGPVEALLGGLVKVIDAGTRAVPTGNRALQFGPADLSQPPAWSADDRFTARLSVPPGAKAIKLTVLPYKTDSSTTAPFRAWLRVAVPNGAVLLSDDWWTPSTEGQKQIELPLPEGVGNEVIFDVNRGPALTSGLILDDLRVE